MQRKLHFICNSYLVVVLTFLLPTSAFSQLSLHSGNYEAGFTLSPSNFLGDLGGTYGKGGNFLKDNNFSNTKLLAGIHFNVISREWLSFRLSLTHGTIAGDDALIEGKGGAEEARKARNLNFKSKITEGIIAAEIYPTVWLERDASMAYHKIRPYLVIGAGIFHYNPKGLDPATNKWVYLKPLHTEGQGFDEYPNSKVDKLVQFNIPVGVGIKYFITDELSISTEALLRKTFSDQLDDVSTNYIDNNLFYKYLPLNTAIVANRMADKSVGVANRNAGDKRGTPGKKDSYYSVGLKLSIRFGNGDGKGSIRCPVVRP